MTTGNGEILLKWQAFCSSLSEFKDNEYIHYPRGMLFSPPCLFPRLGCVDDCFIVVIMRVTCICAQYVCSVHIYYRTIEYGITEITEIQTYNYIFNPMVVRLCTSPFIFERCPPCTTWIEIDNQEFFNTKSVITYSKNYLHCPPFFVFLRFIVDQFARIPQSLTVLALRKWYIIGLHPFLTNTLACAVTKQVNPLTHLPLDKMSAISHQYTRCSYSFMPRRQRQLS